MAKDCRRRRPRRPPDLQISNGSATRDTVTRGAHTDTVKRARPAQSPDSACAQACIRMSVCICTPTPRPARADPLYT